MRSRGSAFLAIALALASACPPLASGGDVVADLGKVEGIDGMKAPPSARPLLQQNGFVVVPRFYHQIFSPYIQEGLPPFVTTDSLHRTFHVIFEEQLKKVETGLSAEAAAISKGMAAMAQARLQKLDKDRAADDPDYLVESYFLVALNLLGEKTERLPSHVDEIAQEVKLIEAAAGVGQSPLFGYEIDYSQYKPRGFYTETPLLQRYFRAMMWYGDAAFRLISDRETQAAMQIAEAWRADGALAARWTKIDRLYTSLIAPPDDLTPEDYAAIVKSMDTMDMEDPLAYFKQQAQKLRDPKINSMVLTPEQMPRWRELTKGMRFFGRRYVPDSEVFMNLTDPAVPGRSWPSGLDVMAVLGSARARQLQEQTGVTKNPAYEKGFQASTEMMKKLVASEKPSHYVETFKLTRTLLAPPAQDALPFMKTAAYTDKNLASALAAWTSLRHAWMLHAKQSADYLGIAQAVPGYVEPNFAFYDQLHKLIRQTIALLGAIEGVEKERLERLDRLVLDIAEIGRRQSRGQALNEEQEGLLQNYAPTIAGLMYFEGNSWLSDHNLPWMSLVADVHTDHLYAKCLEEAVGAALPIFVVVPYKGKDVLMVGGVYSYYEFLQPIADRLTDAQWRAMAEAGKVPAMPGWTSSFVAGYDVASILERIKKGEEPEQALYVNDPAFEEFLLGAIAPGGTLDGKQNLSYAMSLCAMKAGKKALPILWKRFVEEQPGENAGEGPWYGAASALQYAVGPEQLPELEQLASTAAHPHKAHEAVRLIACISDKAAEQALTKLLKAGAGEAREQAAVMLLRRGSRDVTPALLEAYPQMQPSKKRKVLEALSFIWGGLPEGYPQGPERFPQQMDEKEEAALRPKVDALVLSALNEKDKDVRKAAVTAAGNLKLAEAVALIEKAFGSDASPHDAARALVNIGTEEAFAALVRQGRHELQQPGQPGEPSSSTLNAIEWALQAARTPAAKAALQKIRARP